MATLQAFDTLGYVKTLESKGYERKYAEALAEAQQEFFAKDVATETFVRAEIEKAVTKLDSKIELENALLENRLVKTIGRMFIASVSILAVVMPVIYMVLQKLLVAAP